jgi:hypothetical protein
VSLQIFPSDAHQATKLLGVAQRLSIDLALCPGAVVLGEPKESPLDLVDEFDNTWSYF